MRRRDFSLALGAAVIAAPRAAVAQEERKKHFIAILHPAVSIADMSASGSPNFSAFFEELRRLGYAEGTNLIVARRSADGDERRILDLAHELAELKPAAIFAITNRAVAALKATTTTIPIVAFVADPVFYGLAAYLARPGGNITGFTVDAGREFSEKLLALLKEAIPTAAKIALLNPRGAVRNREGYEEAAKSLRFTPIAVPLDPPVDEREYRRAFSVMARDRVDAVYVTVAPENYVHRRTIAKLAVEAKLPTIFAFHEPGEAGGLMAYTFDSRAIYRGAAGYIDLILKGANPAEMPFQQPAKWKLIINLKTAKALGLAIPESLLARADEVIE
ncbi:MAG: ABC transporter substrate-binding protein [Deltaproteobacteria bacterium]|nr:ABC transporter substrate-binding protein [Deltaproteobacteria bacterium]